jgi:hypothetical protein
LKLKNVSLERTKAKLLTGIGFPRSANGALNVYPDDVFVVSYPRSGNTWMRFLVGELIFRKEINFQNVQSFIPDPYLEGCTHSYLEALARPRYIKSHEPYDVRYPKVIYLVRDPRDVSISYYHWLLKFKNVQETFDDFLNNFISNTVHKQFWYGGWGNHVASWYHNAGSVPQGLLFIRYEDLLANPSAKLFEVALFLGVEVSESRLEAIVQKNKFKRMQEKEQAGRETVTFKGDSRPDIRFVREGTSQQWKEQLAKKNVRFKEVFGAMMHQFGYE